MKLTLLFVAVTSFMKSQELESGIYNYNYPSLYPDNTQNETQYQNGNIEGLSSFYQDSNYNTDASSDNGIGNLDYSHEELDYQEKHRCPPNWILYKGSCYRFVIFPKRSRQEARKICQAYEGDLAAINNPEKYGFIITNLMKIDLQKGSWYVGAHRKLSEYWVNDVDGSQIIGLDNAFFDDKQSTYTRSNLFPKDYLVYKFSHPEGRWGLVAVEGTQHFHFICEGQTQKLHYLIDDERSFTYGLDTYDPERIPRGPFFIKNPVDTIYDLSRDRYAQITCKAGGYPTPIYKWYKEVRHADQTVDTEIDPLSNDRFVLSGGTLMIYYPHKNNDTGKYYCTASNKFGTIRSETVRLSFGFIREFYQKRPVESGNQYSGKSIYCNPPSYYPDVSFLWARDYFPNFVEDDKRVFVSHDGSLYFSSLETIDRGNYSCNVLSSISDHGRIGPFFPLVVYPHSKHQHMKFPNNFPKVFPKAPIVGREVRLECISFGYPVPSYNWTKRNGSIPKKAHLSSYNKVLTIPNISVEDEGEYICDVSNNRSHIYNSVFLRVQAEPNFTIPLTSKHMDNKGELRWNCEAFGIPDVNYTWWKNGKKLTTETLEEEDRDRYIIQDYVLIIKYLDPSRDPGMYQCEAKNQLKSSFSTGQLRVLSLKPSFKKRPLESETYGSEGGNVTLRCNPEAAPKPTFTWKKDNIFIRAGGKHFISENGNLVIRQLSRDDEGLYTCVAKNRYGTDESSGRLVVLHAPRFIDRLPPSITSQVNQTAFLHCKADIDPILDIAYLWYHNGIRVMETTETFAGKRFKIDGGELTIYNVSLSDIGNYECVVKSAVGKISSHTQLRIVGPPCPPGGLQILNMQKTSVTLKWTDNSSNGSPITGYIVTARTNWDSTWYVISENVANVIEIERNNRRKRATISTNLTPWTVYEFRVQAVNMLGEGQPSAASPQFSTPADKPYEAPLNVSGGGGQIGELTITWTPLPPSRHNGPRIHYKIFWRRNSSEVEFQSMLLQKYGNVGRFVVHIPPTYFYTPYDVKVQAFNDEGAGPESEVVTIYSADDIPHVAPPFVVAHSYNSTALNVTWKSIDQSQDRLRGEIIGYRLKYWNRQNNEEECMYYLSRTSRTWALIGSLEPDTYYAVRVIAVNSAGDGPQSELYVARTFRKAPQRPPTSVNVWAYNHTTVRVMWRYVKSSHNEEPLLGYKVRLWEDDQEMSAANDTIVPVENKRELYITNLKPGQTYNLRILAYSIGGDGRMSSPVFVFQMAHYQPDSYDNYTTKCAPSNATCNITSNAICSNTLCNTTSNTICDTKSNVMSNIPCNNTSKVTSNTPCHITSNTTSNVKSNIPDDTTYNVTSNIPCNTTYNTTTNAISKASSNIPCNITSNATSNIPCNTASNTTTNATSNASCNITSNSSSNTPCNTTFKTTHNKIYTTTSNATSNKTTSNTKTNTTFNTTPNTKTNINTNSNTTPNY